MAANIYISTIRSVAGGAVNNLISIQDFIANRNVNPQLNDIASMSAEGTIYSLISREQNWQIMNERR